MNNKGLNDRSSGRSKENGLRESSNAVNLKGGNSKDVDLVVDGSK
jgi:hypothetical protein